MLVTTHMRVEEVSVLVTTHMRVEGGISACHYTHEGGGRYQCMSLHI